MVWGCLATLCVIVGDCRLDWWWPLAVAGVVKEFPRVIEEARRVSMYVIKQPYYSVHMCVFRRYM